VQTLWQDIRYALRLFRRSPGFVAVAVVSLALGTGANGALFSLLNSLVWRELPIPEPNRLVHVGLGARDGYPRGLSFPMYETIAQRQQVFSSMLAWWGDGIFNVEANGVLTRGDIWAVSGNFHAELGVQPLAGRLLTPADVDLRTKTPSRVAVIGHGFWQRQYGGAPDVIGQTVRVEGEPFTIIGIGPAGFTAVGLVSEPDVTIPLTAVPLINERPGAFERTDSLWLDIGGRLRPGVTIEQAQAQLASMWPGIRAASVSAKLEGAQRDEFLALTMDVASLARGQEWFLRRRFTRPLTIVLGVAGLVLLIACVNLASLMLSRMSLRAPEMALRGALGASRGRLIRQVTTESLLLSMAGSALGLLFAVWSSTGLSNLMTADYLVPSRLTVTPDWRVLAFTSALATIAGLLVSVAPAWRATRRDLLAGSPQGARASAGVGRVTKSLVVVQTALSVVILMDTGLLVRTLHHFRTVDSGLRSEGVIVARIYPQPDGYAKLVDDTYYPQLVARVAALPDVQAAGLSTNVPQWGSDWRQPVKIAGAVGETGANAAFASISPGLLDTLGLRVLQGRDLRWSDDSKASRVALVSQALAHHLFPKGDAVGRRIDLGNDPKRQGLEIVGVVSDARYFDVRNPSLLTAYAPTLQHSGRYGAMVVRSTRGAAIAPSLRRAIESLGHEHVLHLRSLEQAANRALLQERVTAWLAGFFGGLALLLSLIGLCGLMLYTVTQRTREIGIRVAIGAARTDVVLLILRETLTLVAAGIAIGAPLALAGSRLVSSLVSGVTPTDPLTLMLVAAVLLAVGAAAGFVPARRASRIDPMDALRS
jgi:putative ABC transport system permease protein